MLLAKDISDESCISVVLSCGNVSVSLAPHQSSVLNHIWALEVALTEMLLLPVWGPLFKSCPKGKQVLGFWKSTRRWLQTWQCIISVVFPYWGLSLGFKMPSGAVNTPVFVFTLLSASWQKSTGKGHLSGKLRRSLWFLTDRLWYSFPYWHQQMQVNVNLSDLQLSFGLQTLYNITWFCCLQCVLVTFILIETKISQITGQDLNGNRKFYSTNAKTLVEA